MRIGCLQFAPQSDKVDRVNNNMNRADRILSRPEAKGSKSIASESELDLLVLPKMAFSGSNFATTREIQPFLEPAAAGATTLWARTTAILYDCHVVVGYPQQVKVACTESAGVEYFSSSIMVDETGNSLANNPGRTLNGQDPIFWDVDTRFGTVSIGQYTDLTDMNLGENESSNPQETEAFAYHILDNGISMAIISMAWKTVEDTWKLSTQPERPDVEALTCWIARLMPLIDRKLKREITIVLCNRSGLENGVMYAGTSAVLRIQDGEVHAYGIMGGYEDGLLVVDTSEDISAKGVKLWPRPEEVVCKGEQDTEFSSDAERQAAFYGGVEAAQENLAKYTLCEEDILYKQNAFQTGNMSLLAVSPGPAVAAKKRTRPKLFIPKSPSEPPREILVSEYRARAAALPQFNASNTTVRSPTASTPYPNGSHRHWRSHHTSKRYAPRTFRPLASATPMTPFEDPTTAISPSPQCRDTHWSPFTPDGGSPYSTGQSSEADTMASDFQSSSGRHFRGFERPRSPKSRNVKIPASVKLQNGEEDSGTIPILASPSIIATESQAGGRGSSEHRGRRREQRQLPLEEQSRSSSRDSTRNTILHRRVKHSNSSADRPIDGQREQSASSRRPRQFSRSSSLPALHNDQSQAVEAMQTPTARKAGLHSWPTSKEELQRAMIEIHGRLMSPGC